MIRIITSAVAIGVCVSAWVIAFALFLFFSVAAVKRLAELPDADGSNRRVTRRGYQVADKAFLSQKAVASG